MTDPQIPTEPGFDEVLARLEAIVTRLERPDLPLDEAMLLYEEGVKLTGTCAVRLREAELRIEELRPAPEDRKDP